MSDDATKAAMVQYLEEPVVDDVDASWAKERLMRRLEDSDDAALRVLIDDHTRLLGDVERLEAAAPDVYGRTLDMLENLDDEVRKVTVERDTARAEVERLTKACNEACNEAQVLRARWQSSLVSLRTGTLERERDEARRSLAQTVEQDAANLLTMARQRNRALAIIDYAREALGESLFEADRFRPLVPKISAIVAERDRLRVMWAKAAAIAAEADDPPRGSSYRGEQAAADAREARLKARLALVRFVLDTTADDGRAQEQSDEDSG